MRCASAAFALIVFALAGPAAAGAPEPSGAAAPNGADERSALIIDAGRLVVMMDQSQAALKVLGAGAAHADLAPAAAQRAYAFQELVAAVLHYNLLLQKACRSGIAARGRCTGPYLPVWLNDPPGRDHSETDLRLMVEEASARMVPFWSDVCGKGQAAAHDDSFCGLE